MYYSRPSGARREGGTDMVDESIAWAVGECLGWRGDDPAELLEHLMASGACPAFGPVHHFLVGASLLSCAWPEGRDGLGAALEELAGRASRVPGAACASWGVCGAAASCGMAFSILAGNAPLRPEGWSEGQLMVADILGKIARAGSPRCCKRDSRIAVRAAVPWFDRELGCAMEVGADVPSCAVSGANSACLGAGCPFFAGR